MNEINQYWIKYKDNPCEETLNELAIKSQYLIQSFVGRYLKGIYTIAPFDFDDLMIEGFVGFLQAVSTHKEGTGCQFSTYLGLKVNVRLLDA